eukprot:111319_1
MSANFRADKRRRKMILIFRRRKGPQRRNAFRWKSVSGRKYAKLWKEKKKLEAQCIYQRKQIKSLKFLESLANDKDKIRIEQRLKSNKQSHIQRVIITE